MRSSISLLIVALLSSMIHDNSVLGDVRPSGLIADKMVLQQGRKVPIWGTADSGEKVSVRFRDQEAATVAVNGRWNVLIPSGRAGGPFPLTIIGKNTLEFQDVLVGEVWLCSGQSNMGWPVATRPNPKLLDGTENSQIRLFTVPERLSETSQEDVAGSQWQSCGPQTVGKFSAVAYYFGRDLQQSLKVPVGLIHASYGGSSIFSWINPTAMQSADLHDLRQPRLESRLYNGMVAPLRPYGLRGVIWYQGEADARSPAVYQRLFPALIHGWRAEWKQGDFPFYFVQLAPYGQIVNDPQESSWAALRKVQLRASQTVPGTGMAVITDCGHETEIHPLPKQPVGQRLALLALARTYGQQVVYSGPAFSGMTIKSGKATLIFQHVGGGLEARPMVLENVVKNARTGQSGGALHVQAANVAGAGATAVLKGFTIAGADRRFVNARAEIRGAQVVVWADEITEPAVIRYGWADYPTGNLFNKEGLPASPFEADKIAD
ncbi:MAG: Sialate O-acetylesterase [Planctomycetaceae bacterium]|nr:Sialate O-acetylesterase [Planctomycetaceae bacterium]